MVRWTTPVCLARVTSGPLRKRQNTSSALVVTETGLRPPGTVTCHSLPRCTQHSESTRAHSN
eukprot:1928640-Rhodomonas_salina.2